MQIFNLSDFSGYFHISENGCALVLQKDLEYWLLDELIMEPCCALKYFPKIEVNIFFEIQMNLNVKLDCSK